jgi:hypothetical protein
MSFELRSEGGSELQLGGSTWSLCLRLAEAYGWKPTGTTAPKRRSRVKWSGGYDSSDGQGVTARDAADLATALERAAKDPSRRTKIRAVQSQLNRDVLELAKQHGIEIPDDFEDDEEVKLAAKDLKALVAFFRAGAFEVW